MIIFIFNLKKSLKKKKFFKFLSARQNDNFHFQFEKKFEKKEIF